MASILFPASLGFRDAVPFRGNLAFSQPGPPPPGSLALADNCIFTPTLGGLTDWSAAAPVLGSRMPIEAGCIIGNRYHYVARSADQTQWEGGIGTCSGEYISRSSVLWSSNGGLPVNFTVIPTVSLDALASDFGGVRTQRSVTTTPIVILSTDQILNCNIPTQATCALPPSASRNGVPLTFKDVGGQCAVNNIFLIANGSETIDGAASIGLTLNRQSVTVVPLTDGVNTGWAIE
jgi:hypothetical protein